MGAAVSDGIMVSLDVPLVLAGSIIESLPAQDDLEPVENLHITLAYLGKMQDYDNIDDLRAVVNDVAQMCAGYVDGPFSGHIGGLGAFYPANDGIVVVALPSVAGLSRYRTLLVDKLSEYGYGPTSEYDFIPHITLKYGNVDGAEQVVGHPLFFPTLSVHIGGEVTSYEFEDNRNGLKPNLSVNVPFFNTDGLIGDTIGQIYASDGTYRFPGTEQWLDGKGAYIWTIPTDIFSPTIVTSEYVTTETFITKEILQGAEAGMISAFLSEEFDALLQNAVHDKPVDDEDRGALISLLTSIPDIPVDSLLEELTVILTEVNLPHGEIYDVVKIFDDEDNFVCVAAVVTSEELERTRSQILDVLDSNGIPFEALNEVALHIPISYTEDIKQVDAQSLIGVEVVFEQLHLIVGPDVYTIAFEPNEAVSGYKVVSDHAECDGWALVRREDDVLVSCHENETEAKIALKEKVKKDAAKRDEDLVRHSVDPSSLADLSTPEKEDAPMSLLDQSFEKQRERCADTSVQFQGVGVLEGYETGDRRFIQPFALSNRKLPLPLMFIDRRTEAHMESGVAGVITDIWREEVEQGRYAIMIQGHWSNSEYGQKARAYFEEGSMRGVSADLGSVSVAIEETGSEIDNGPRMVFTAGKIMGACYDDATEVLTENSGWVRFADLAKGERVATMDQKTGSFEWQEPTHYTNDPWSGKMIHFTSGGVQKGGGDPKRYHKALDLLVTPNHRMLVRSNKTGKLVIMRADELATKSAHSYAFPMTSTWEAPEVATIKIDGSRWGTPSIFEMNADDFAALMGAWLSEGCTLRGSGGRPKGLSIAQRPESKGRPLFDQLADKLGMGSDYRGYSYHNVILGQWVQQFGTATEKFVPEEIKNLSARQIEIFLDYYIAGDGDAEGRRIYTSSKQMADDLQELAQKAGMWARVTSRMPTPNSIDGRIIDSENPQYTVQLRNRPGSRPATHTWDWKAEVVENHEGMVRCVTVPNEILYVRRNGIPAWCGNTIVPFPAFEDAGIWLFGEDTLYASQDSEAIVASGGVPYAPEAQVWMNFDWSSSDSNRFEFSTAVAEEIFEAVAEPDLTEEFESVISEVLSDEEPANVIISNDQGVSEDV